MSASVPVSSSNLASVAYDPEGQILQIIFRSGGRMYRYDGVPPAVYLTLLAAPSKGRYFHRRIKHVYGWTRL